MISKTNRKSLSERVQLFFQNFYQPDRDEVQEAMFINEWVRILGHLPFKVVDQAMLDWSGNAENLDAKGRLIKPAAAMIKLMAQRLVNESARLALPPPPPGPPSPWRRDMVRDEAMRRWGTIPHASYQALQDIRLEVWDEYNRDRVGIPCKGTIEYGQWLRAQVQPPVGAA